MPQLAIIGAGNMGSAIVRGAIERGVLKAPEVIALEPDPGRAAALRDLGVAVAGDPRQIRDVATLLLAVKPQTFPTVASELAPLPGSTVVISIMAGIEGDTIREALGGRVRVVRAMPNTPCQIGLGMTAIALAAGSRRGDESMAVKLFSAIGLVEMVDESLLHAVTAVSGSGPAYLFLLAEAMEAAAASLGFTAQQARAFVIQTLVGASALLRASPGGPGVLREAVTSRGGTTEAALSVLRRRGFGDLVRQAIAAANNRGVELSRPAAVQRGSTDDIPRASEEETRA